MFKKLSMILCGAILLMVAPVVADQWDKKTTVTFSHPVELPGVVLPAGTYVFKLLDSAQNRHIVQVYNKDQNHLYTTILAIPNYRLKPTAETVLPFAERQPGNAEAIRAWFYPADNFGQEFVYPKKRARELAETTKAPVLMAAVTPADKPEELVKEAVTAAAPEQKEVTVEIAQATPPRPVETREPAVARGEPLPPPPYAAPPQELPKTASLMPLLILVGFGSLGVALLLGVISRRIV